MSRTSTDPVSKDTVFDILSNARRRYVLHYLREKGEPVELGELAQELAAWENETTVEELTKQQRKRVYVSLYQTHIQKLANAGLVEYDRDTGMIALGDHVDQIGEYLSGPDEGEHPRWQESYIVLAVSSGIIYALVALDVFVFSFVSELQAGVVIVAAFLVLATEHYLYTRKKRSEIPAGTLTRTKQ